MRDVVFDGDLNQFRHRDGFVVRRETRGMGGGTRGGGRGKSVEQDAKIQAEDEENAGGRGGRRERGRGNVIEEQGGRIDDVDGGVGVVQIGATWVKSNLVSFVHEVVDGGAEVILWWWGKTRGVRPAGIKLLSFFTSTSKTTKRFPTCHQNMPPETATSLS